MNLNNFLKEGKIEKINVSINDARNRLIKAIKNFNFAKKNFGEEDNDIIYSPIYDAIRIACTSLLLLYGYRARKGTDHHFIVINSAKDLLDGEMENEFNRIQKTRKKRNKLEYGDLDSISNSELKQVLADAEKLINKIDELIKEKERKQALV